MAKATKGTARHTMADIKNYTLTLDRSILRPTRVASWLELDGDGIQRADPHIGLLHRATEKLARRARTCSRCVHGPVDYVS